MSTRYIVKLQVPDIDFAGSKDCLGVTIYNEKAAAYLYEALVRAGEEAQLVAEGSEVVLRASA